jgi:hypothetical protein
MIYSNELNKSETNIVNSSNLYDGSQNENPSLSDSTSILNSSIPSFKRILVTYDDSEKSDKAIKYAIYLRVGHNSQQIKLVL